LLTQAAMKKDLVNALRELFYKAWGIPKKTLLQF
jgi:hypothetical protein